jgi:nitrate/nitrite sensing protein/histidine kinase/DNA gyrase B/HSP90-like ATPase
VTQSPSADVIPSGAMPAGPELAWRNRRVARLLIALIAIPAVLALALTGFWVTSTARSAGAYGQVGRLAALGQQVTSLAQAMADERSATATFIPSGRPVAGLAALHQRYAITDAHAAGVRRLVSQLGHGYPAQTRAEAAQVLASIAKLPGLRRQAAQSQASALAVMTGYSAAISGLFPVTDGIADLSGNSTLMTSVRALGSLARMSDHASQQQAMLSVALATGRFAPGMLGALTTARAQQATDLASFRNSATPEESGALAEILARPLARRAQAVEQRAIAAGNGVLALGPGASHQWPAGMSYTVGWMDHAEQQLAGWIAADAQSLQRSTMRSAIVTGVAALGVLALVLLGIIFAARSWLRRRRRLEAADMEAAALEGTRERLAIGAGDVSAGFSWRNHELLERLLRQIDSMELNEDDPERLANLFEMDHLATRIWRNSDSALVLAGHEPPRPVRPLALVDVLRAAASEIEEYSRVILDVQQGVCVSGSAATDTVHLVAELLENATTFSSQATQVIVSGHAVVGGGSLITITDGGPGMSDEELALFNWQLDNPASADMAIARRMGLFAVALLAGRHGITVTLSRPPDGGTTAEVYLPAALISLGTAPNGWHGRPGEAALTAASEETGADPSFSAPRFASGPEPHPGLETDEPEAVPAMLGAPVASPAPAASTAVPDPDPVDAQPGDGLPIFESVRSGYLHAFGRDLPRSGGQQAGQSPGRPAGPPAAWGEDNGRAGDGSPASPGLPQRPPQPGQVHGAAADQETQQTSAAESAETTRSKLASFQNGSRRARAVAQMNRSAKQPGQDG